MQGDSLKKALTTPSLCTLSNVEARGNGENAEGRLRGRQAAVVMIGGANTGGRARTDKSLHPGGILN